MTVEYMVNSCENKIDEQEILGKSQDWPNDGDWRSLAVIQNKAFYFYCGLLCKADVKEIVFITGYNRWKKPMETNSGLTAHNNSFSTETMFAKI